MPLKVTDDKLREWLALEFTVEEMAHLARPCSVADIQARLDALDSRERKARLKAQKGIGIVQQERIQRERVLGLRNVPRKRPLPPEALFDADKPLPFVPAPDLRDWLLAVFMAPGGELVNERHEHLLLADIGVLWSSVANDRKGQRILGQAESPFPRGDKWGKARQIWQLEQWFGLVPDFVLTFDAHYALHCDDWQWCALCEHELLHCGQMLDEENCPVVNEDTGKPRFRLVGHDVEQFVDVVARYGMRAANVEALVAAALAGPEFADVDIEGACGTCLK